MLDYLLLLFQPFKNRCLMIHYSFQTPHETRYSNSIISKIIYSKNKVKIHSDRAHSALSKYA